MLRRWCVAHEPRHGGSSDEDKGGHGQGNHSSKRRRAKICSRVTRSNGHNALFLYQRASRFTFVQFVGLQQTARRRARNTNTLWCEPIARSCSNNDVGELSGSRELSQLRRHLRAHKPEPPPGGLGTKQKPSATTRCSVSCNGTALGGQAETGGSIPPLPAVAAVATASNVTARSIKSNWPAACRAREKLNDT